MIFEVEKDIFLNAIQKVQSIIEKRHAIPLLSNVMLNAENQKLEVIATDLEIGIRDVIDINVVEPGSITIPAKVLYEVLKELSEEKITFKLEENNWIRLSCGNSVFKVVGMPIDDFPKLPPVEEEKLIPISGEILDNLTRKTIYAVSHDENRKTLNGVLFKVLPTTIVMVATDGHRMAMIETENKANLPEQELIIPQKAVHELQRMVASGNENIYFGVTGNHIAFKVNNELVISRMLEGQFPNYNMVIPKERKVEIQVPRNSFYNSLRRVAVFSDLKAHGVQLALKENVIEINSNTPEYGEAKDSLNITYSGESITLGFNVNYLLDLLKNIDSELISIVINNSSGPVLFQPTDQKEFTYYAVVMPMII
jgi:DNA polymerase III subunit beta